MSKTSYFLIGIMVAVTVLMGALHGYRAFTQYRERQAALEAPTFQEVPVSMAAPQADFTPPPIRYAPETSQDVFLEDAPLSPQQEAEQADLTVRSILADYAKDPVMQQFNRELSSATQGQAKDLADLSGPRLQELMQSHPQVAQVVQKYMKKPEFSAAVEQIFSNPQYVQSVRVLQGENHVPAAPAEPAL